MTLHIDVAESSGGRSDKASKGTQNANTFESTSHRAGSTDEATTSVHLENNVEISEAGNIVKGSFKEGIILQQDSCKEQRDFKMQPSKNAESQNTQRSRSKVAKSRLMGESMRPGSTRDDNVGGSPGSSYPITVTNAPIYLTPDQNMRARLRGKSDGHTPENRNTSQSDRKCQTPLQHAERAGSEGNNVFHREAEGPRITSRGAPENEKWKYIVTKLEPFLDVHSLLMLRQTCVVLHRHKYTINPNNELCFRGFVGFDIDFVLDKVFPLVTKVLRIKEDAKLRLDFSQCYNFRDMSVVRMLTTQAMLNNDTRTQRLCRNMRSLVLDFCPQLTDQGLAVMLATRLPNLEKLSIVCCRNQALTGAPFVKSLSTECWPSFKRFNCNFSNITLEPIQAVAQFILRAAGGIAKGMSAEVTARSASWEADGAESERSWCTLGDLEPNSEVKQYVEKCYVVPQLVGAATALCQLDVIGSWGSRSFLDRQGFAPELQAFAKGVKMRAKKLCSKLTKRVQRRLEDSGSAASANGDALLVLLAQRGSELLVNCPIIEHDSHNAMNVWTLPISIAIESDDMDMCNLLIRRGARVSVWDYCGKSPLYKACEMSRTAFVRLLLKLGQAPQPLESSLSPMAVCIKNGNTFYLEQLLKVGAQINMRCPHVRNFKSPLYIACEANNKECIEMLLKSGADTNWVYHGRVSVTLLAYQNDSAWLPIFLDYGAGRPRRRRFVLTDVMSCAISNGDVSAVELLADAYPDLLQREQLIWSSPFLQAARLGQAAIMRALLAKGADADQKNAYGTTAAHAVAEEGRVECLNLLIQHRANLDVQDADGRTPLYLAVLENRRELAETLLASKCNPNVAEFVDGETPLMAALRTRNEELALLILNAASGLKLDAADKLGRSACIYALYFEQFAVGEVVLRKCAASGVQGSVTEVRWFNAVASERMEAEPATYRQLRRYARHYREVNARVIRESGTDLLLSARWNGLLNLLSKFRGQSAKN